MNCTDLDNLIDSYIDQHLSADEHARVSAHVAGCKACETRVVEAQRLGALLRTAVADRVAAVGVSGAWNAVAEVIHEQVSGRTVTESVIGFRAGFVRHVREWFDSVGDSIGALWAPGRWRYGMAAAGIALVAVMVMDYSEPSPKRVKVVSSKSGGKSRGVKIQSLDVAEGHTVSTWRLPKMRTAVIWVASAEGN